MAAPAEARDRGLAGAQTAARAVVALETAEAVHCFRATARVIGRIVCMPFTELQP